jgi:hypothetical protein
MKKSLAFAFVLALPGLATADGKTFNGGKGATVDCGKDPEVNINHGKGTYTFKGACKTININGGENKLTIESVETLNVNGGHNTADIGAADTINVVGASNTITYKKGPKGEKPAINIVGDGNKVDKAK